MFGSPVEQPRRLEGVLPEIVLAVLFALSLPLLWQGRSVSDAAKAAAPRSVAPVAFFAMFNQAPANYQVVDTRSREMFEQGHIPVALSVPLEQLSDPAVVGGLDRWKTTVVVSDDGDEAAYAAAAPLFVRSLNLEGGMRAWRLRGLASVPGPPGAKTTLA